MGQVTIRIRAETDALSAQLGEVTALLETLPATLREVFSRLLDDLLAHKLIQIERLPAAVAGELLLRASIPWLAEFRALALRALDFHEAPPGLMTVSGDSEPSTGGASSGSADPEQAA